jgi:hypothetical protein
MIRSGTGFRDGAPILIAYDGSAVSGPPSNTLVSSSPGVRLCW